MVNRRKRGQGQMALLLITNLLQLYYNIINCKLRRPIQKTLTRLHDKVPLPKLLRNTLVLRLRAKSCSYVKKVNFSGKRFKFFI